MGAWSPDGRRRRLHACKCDAAAAASFIHLGSGDVVCRNMLIEVTLNADSDSDR